MNIIERIFQDADGMEPALIADESVLTYGRLAELVGAASAQLEKSGALKAQGVPRIGLSCPNGLAHVIFALAIVRAGGCLIPIAGELSPVERDALALATGAHSIVVVPGGEWSHRLAGQAVRIEIPGFCATVLAGLRENDAAALAFDEDQLSALKPAFIRFSSGTTGTSKGVVLSHQSLLERVTAANRALKIGPSDRVVWILPMAHHFAVSIMLYLLHGATTVIVNSHFPGDVLAAARAQGGTVIYGAPFHHALLAAESSGLPWPGLRLAVSTAASLPPPTARAFETRFGIPLAQALGIIEVGLPFLNVDAPRKKPDSVGRPLPDFSAEVRDENGLPVPAGQAGELFVRGPGMLDAYLAPWRVREEILQAGWFRTGDFATIDDEGFVRLCGRAQSVINVAGMKCFPEEIEAVLCAHPAVRAARVFARPHPTFGSVPAAELVARNAHHPPEAIELVRHCRNELAAFKIPVEFRFVDSLTLTPSGKIRR
jgi:long-chain acyl-CoA synthetase